MGKADNDNAGPSGGRGGNSGGGSGGSSSGGRGGGFNGRDTPGSPNAADGKRGSTMGADGGVAPGRSTGGAGVDTPGSPENEGRRGTVAGAGVSATESARRARSTMQSAKARSLVGESTTDYGVGDSYSHQDAIAERAKTGMVSPREMEMARGYHAGRESELATQAIGGFASKTLGSIAGNVAAAAPGMISEAQKVSPEASYGAAVGKNQASNSTAQSVGQAVAGATMGPIGGLVAGAVNTGINTNKTADYGRMSEALGFNSSPSEASGVGGGNAAPSKATPAMQQARAALTAGSPSNTAPTIDMDAYSSGLNSLSKHI